MLRLDPGISLEDKGKRGDLPSAQNEPRQLPVRRFFLPVDCK